MRTAASESRARRALVSRRPRALPSERALPASRLAGLFAEHFGRAVEALGRRGQGADRPRGPGRPRRGRGEGGPEGEWRGRPGGRGSPAPAAAARRPPRGQRERGRRRLPARVPGLRWARMSGFLEELLGEKLVTGSGEEVDVHSLGSRGISLLGLYFGCSLSAPCAQLSGSLAAFYGRLRGDAAAGPGLGAGAAAEPEPRRRLEIVFVSSDQDQRQWQDFVRDMPWLALPYKEKHRKVSGAGLVGAPGLGAQPARPRDRGPHLLPPYPRIPVPLASVFPSSACTASHSKTPPGWGWQLLGAGARPRPPGEV